MALLIGLLSDTHDHVNESRRAVRLLKERGVEAILHLGDIVAPFTLKAMLEEYRAITAVYGNNCGEKLGLKRVAEEYNTVIQEPPMIYTFKGYRILMFHGSGPASTTISLAKSLAKSGDYDFVVYGHTHRTHVEKIGGTLVVNPGETCGCLTGKKTVAILDLDERKAEILEL